MRHSYVHSSQDRNSSYSIVQNLTNHAQNDHLMGLPQTVIKLMVISDVFVLQVVTSVFMDRNPDELLHRS